MINFSIIHFLSKLIIIYLLISFIYKHIQFPRSQHEIVLEEKNFAPGRVSINRLAYIGCIYVHNKWYPIATSEVPAKELMFCKRKMIYLNNKLSWLLRFLLGQTVTKSNPYILLGFTRVYESYEIATRKNIKISSNK